MSISRKLVTKIPKSDPPRPWKLGRQDVRPCVVSTVSGSVVGSARLMLQSYRCQATHTPERLASDVPRSVLARRRGTPKWRRPWQRVAAHAITSLYAARTADVRRRYSSRNASRDGYASALATRAGIGPANAGGVFARRTAGCAAP